MGVSPHVVMSYASLVNLSHTLTALAVPVDYGAGTQWSSGLLSLLPNASLQLGLWLVDLIDSVNDGTMDQDITALADYLSTLDRPVFLRLGYEFDSVSNHYHPSSYRKAFRRIVNLFEESEVSNVAFVWHATGEEPRDGLALESWFPGEEYVDWCGLSFFLQPYSCQIPTKCIFPFAETMVSFCKRYSLPVMIAESTPFGGIIDDDPMPSGEMSVNEAGYEGSSWNSWFIPVLEFIEKHEVKMWNYIACDWDRQEMWQRERAPGVHWGDTRIEVYRGVKEKWHHDVLENKRYSWRLAPLPLDPDRDDIKSGGPGEGKSNQTDDDTSAPTIPYPVCHTIETKEVIQPTERRAIRLFVSAAVILLLAFAVCLFFQHQRQNSHEYVTIH
jgi:hypothetical protein